MRVVALAACVALGTSGCAFLERGPVLADDPVATRVTPAATTASPDPSDLVFDDEFNEPAAAGPNDGLPAPVWYTDGCWQRGCMETLAAFHPENAQQDGQGNLVLTARPSNGLDGQCGNAGPCRYTSSRLTMLDWANGGTPSWGMRGGHLEARIQAPIGKGLWPAFWTVGSDQAQSGWPGGGEIDVFEAVGQQPTRTAQVLHGPNRGVDDMQGQLTTMTSGDISGWHTYAIDWDPSPNGYIAWSIDGEVQTVVHAGEAGPAWDAFTKPHSMILDLAVGGLPGEPDPRAFPAEMRVDYIRAYRTSLLEPQDSVLSR